MNVANLQLEGLMMAVASINNVLVHKGLLSIDDIDIALRKAEASVAGDERTYEDMSPANRDASASRSGFCRSQTTPKANPTFRRFRNWQKWLGKRSSLTTISSGADDHTASVTAYISLF